MRLMSLGNSGSGKSALAAQVVATFLVTTHDLDHFHWHANGRKRNEAEARALVADVATGPAWIIEGVYGWLAEVALLRATDLVWLDLPWAECQDGSFKIKPFQQIINMRMRAYRRRKVTSCRRRPASTT